MSPTLSGFLDLVQLADHPGDMLTYRHFCFTPLARVMYPEGVPDSLEISSAMASAFARRGMVAVFKSLRTQLPSVGGYWEETFEPDFQSLLRAAAEFERDLKADSRLADFARLFREVIVKSGRVSVLSPTAIRCMVNDQG